ncbi:piggyBac transposable element-derived protein 3-like [Pimephales promelas]|nr:piggyBac transposable element-derived protein 3-like [Pimephales promelas]
MTEKLGRAAEDAAAFHMVIELFIPRGGAYTFPTIFGTGERTTLKTSNNCRRLVGFTGVYRDENPTFHAVKPHFTSPKMGQKKRGVAVYNKSMGGVDLLDSLIALYRTKIRSKKWYHRIVFHMLDMTLVNAWLLKKTRDCKSQMPEIAHLSLLDFQIHVASCLCMESKARRKRKGRPSQAVEVGKNKRGPQSFVPPDPVRRDRTDHWPLHASEEGRCKMPGCKGIVRSKCSKCTVYLCFTAERNCFVDFH